MFRFLLDSAMTEASAPGQDPAPLKRNRTMAMTISRTLGQWMTRYEARKKGNAVGGKTARPAVAAARTVKPAVAERPMPVAPKAARPVPADRAAAAEALLQSLAAQVFPAARLPRLAPPTMASSLAAAAVGKSYATTMMTVTPPRR